MKRVATLTSLALLFTSVSASAQGPGLGSGTRFGVSFGGVSTVGLTVERFSDNRSIELTLGTWSFRDLSVSGVGKQYVGGRAVQPYVGLGLWMVVASPPDEQTGFALVARAPVGFDFGLNDRHSLGAGLSLSRALAVRRSDPDDEMPLVGRIVPLPELYYRLRN